MYNILKPIADLFKGFPFWFGADKRESNWRDIIDNDSVSKQFMLQNFPPERKKLSEKEYYKRIADYSGEWIGNKITK